MAGRSDNKVIISILGVDLTKGTFAKVGRAVARFGAVAAGVGVAGAMAIGKAAQELSVLSDRAAQANTSADELQRLSTAMSALGVKGSDIESLTTALGYMTRTTGREGLAGMRETLAEIAALPTPMERANALMKDFGRAGLGFSALVQNGPEGLAEAFDKLIAIMPELSNSAANAGDEIADGLGFAAAGIKNAWNETLMAIAQGIMGSDVSFREFGLDVAAYASFAAEVATKNFSAFGHNFIQVFKNIGEAVGEVFERVKALVTMDWSRENKDILDILTGGFEQYDIDGALATLREKLENNKGVEDLMSKLGGTAGGAIASALGGAGASMRTGAGSLIQANSYAALRTTVFSPLRTMTGYLADIVRNTSATTDAIEELPATA